jgi:hypothetical protein
MSALLDYTTLFEIAGLDVPDLRDPPWTPLAPRVLDAPDADIFSAIRSADILLHHPYESFYASVERFIREAADDPQTLSIKMTVYRVGDDTPFVRSLIAAAEAGKQVACVIELNARFDAGPHPERVHRNAGGGEFLLEGRGRQHRNDAHFPAAPSETTRELGHLCFRAAAGQVRREHHDAADHCASFHTRSNSAP